MSDRKWPRLRTFSHPWVLLGLTVGSASYCTPASDAKEGLPASGAEVRERGSPGPQQAFWSALESLCGQAFQGRVTESVPPDPSFDGQTMVMHVRQCDQNQIRIPFFVGADRSRTWVITPTPDGLRLKHDHRHEDGSEDDVTQYGGHTEEEGTGRVQDFHADAFTKELIPAAAGNIWTVEVSPGDLFAYGLRREGADRRFRVEFDLGAPIETPLPPWGG